MNHSRVVINDPLFVRHLERRLGRKLSERELCEPDFEIRFSNGRREFIVIPKIIFPDDLLSRPGIDII